MLRWQGLEDVPPDFGPAVVSIGVFDGVHRGHACVIERAVGRAVEHSAVPVVVTFDPHPVEVVRPGVVVPRLTTLDRRLDLLEGLGVAATVVMPFTEAVAAESPEQFAARVLSECLHATGVVVGADFRFGHRAAGDVALLARIGEHAGFDVESVDAVGEAGSRWSSTQVRQALAEGRVEAAAAVLGRPHRLEGEVVRGDQRGRELGYPTANLAVAPGLLIPADGVYAGLLHSSGCPYPAAISIGSNLTFGGTERRVEAYVLDRTDLELYGQPVGLDLVAHLRPMVAFEGVDPLLAQMARDVERARELLL